MFEWQEQYLTSEIFLLPHTDDNVFDNLLKISYHIPKILKNFSEGHMNVAEHFQKISKNITEDFQGLSRKTQRCYEI